MTKSVANKLSMSSMINVVLDEMLAITEIDPSAVSPDDSFRNDLGFSSQVVSRIYEQAAFKLQIEVSKESVMWTGEHAQCLRELVVHLQSQVALASVEPQFLKAA